MSTPNFTNRNASKIYAIETPDEFAYGDAVEDIRELAASKLNATLVPDSWDDNSSRILSEINITKGKWLVTISIIIRSGYYDGANLDHRTQVEDQNTGEQFEYPDDSSQLPTTLLKAIQSKLNRLEALYAQVSTPLICRGVFSNGEAIYERAGQDKPMFNK